MSCIRKHEVTFENMQGMDKNNNNNNNTKQKCIFINDSLTMKMKKFIRLLKCGVFTEKHHSERENSALTSGKHDSYPSK